MPMSLCYLFPYSIFFYSRRNIVTPHFFGAFAKFIKMTISFARSVTLYTVLQDTSFFRSPSPTVFSKLVYSEVTGESAWRVLFRLLGVVGFSGNWRSNLTHIGQTPVRPHGQLRPHWTEFNEIWCLRIFRKSVEKVHVLFKFDKNNRHIAIRPIYIYDHISLSYF